MGNNRCSKGKILNSYSVKCRTLSIGFYCFLIIRMSKNCEARIGIKIFDFSSRWADLIGIKFIATSDHQYWSVIIKVKVQVNRFIIYMAWNFWYVLKVLFWPTFTDPAHIKILWLINSSRSNKLYTVYWSIKLIVFNNKRRLRFVF